MIQIVNENNYDNKNQTIATGTGCDYKDLGLVITKILNLGVYVSCLKDDDDDILYCSSVR